MRLPEWVEGPRERLEEEVGEMMAYDAYESRREDRMIESNVADEGEIDSHLAIDGDRVGRDVVDRESLALVDSEVRGGGDMGRVDGEEESSEYVNSSVNSRKLRRTMKKIIVIEEGTVLIPGVK
jgi:hypothetical protein